MDLIYRAFHRFGHAKFPNDGSVLGSSQFPTLPQLPPKILLNSKLVKIDPKISILHQQSKSETHTACIIQVYHTFFWNHTYRVGHQFKLKKQDDYFWIDLTTFKSCVYFRGSSDSSDVWLEPKIKVPSSNLACPNPQNTL